jgi:hypothetical protein
MLEWTVEVRNASLARVGQLSEFDLTDFVCVPRVNTLGSWSIKLPNTVLNASGVRVPHALAAVLRTQGSGLIVTGPNGVVLTGPMTFASQESTSDAPDGVWTIEGVSDAVILARPTAFPEPSNSDPATQSVSNDVRSGLGEALMRAYVSANIGPTASTARKLPDLTLSADGGLGVTLSKSPRFQNLLELTQEIALGSGLLFDVVQVGSGRQFQVTAPQDVSASVRWDIANNQLSRSKYGYSAPGVTRVFVAGQGEGTDRTIVEVTTAASLLSEAIWGRIERFVDQRNTDDVDELTQAGLEVLAAEGTTVTSLEVVPSSDLADGFGLTWFLGSWVTIVVNDTEVRAQIVEVPISISTAGVLIGAVVGDATGFDWASVLDARQNRTDARISALEQNAEAAAPFDSAALDGRVVVLEDDVPVVAGRLEVVEGQVSSLQVERPTRVNLSAATTMDVSMTGFDEYELTYDVKISQSSRLYFRVRLGGVMVTASNYYGNQAYGGASSANSTPAEATTLWRPSPADADRDRHTGTIGVFSLNTVSETKVIGHSRSGNLTAGSLAAVFGGSYEASQAHDGVSLYPAAGTMTGYYTLKKVKYS